MQENYKHILLFPYTYANTYLGKKLQVQISVQHSLKIFTYQLFLIKLFFEFRTWVYEKLQAIVSKGWNLVERDGG